LDVVSGILDAPQRPALSEALDVADFVHRPCALQRVPRADVGELPVLAVGATQ
jgi:hypothetical protein